MLALILSVEWGVKCFLSFAERRRRWLAASWMAPPAHLTQRLALLLEHSRTEQIDVWVLLLQFCCAPLIRPRRRLQ